MEKKVVIVTGASSGIGAAVARRLGRDGHRLVLAARRVDRLDQVAADVEKAGGQALVVVTDVTRLEDCQAMHKRCIEKWGRVDVLFNNAGMGSDKPLAQMSLDEIQYKLQLNLYSVIQCTHIVLATMLEQKSGHIINTSSLAGLVALPGNTIYSATKYGVVGFSDALRREMRYLGTGVQVSAFCPGFVPSEINETLKAHAEGRPDAPCVPGLMAPEYVADQVEWLIRHPRRIFILPKSWSILIEVAHNFPWLADALVKFFRPKGR